MKVIFRTRDKGKVLNQLKKIATHYQTKVIQQDKGDNHFIFIKSRIKITEEKRNGETLVYVSGANNNDIALLEQFWGEPIEITEEKMTPMDFVKEISKIPDIVNLTQEDIMKTLEISEREFTQFLRYINRIAKRDNAPSDVIHVASILKNMK